jgi:hypothetical protein
MEGVPMTQTENLREHVRDRYAAAAAAVGSGSGASCCGPADALAAISDIFGASLYQPDQTADLPEEAVLASWAAATRWPSPRSAKARRFSTSAPAAASTSCSRPAGSGRPASPTAWT